jgi:hypothetical protein
MWLNGGQYVRQTDSTVLPGMLFRLGVPFDATDIQVAVDAETSDTAAPNFPLIGYRPVPTPSPHARTTGSAVIRGLRTVAIDYQPLRFDGSRLFLDRSATITVTWRHSGVGGKETGQYKEVPSVEDGLSTYVLNFSTARQWRREQVPVTRVLSAGSEGIGEAVVMLVARDGVYRATVGELIATGAKGISGLPLNKLRLYNRDVQVPIHVADVNSNTLFDGIDFIEFQGRRNPSDEGFYYDQVTDSNAYLLRWNQSGDVPARLISASGSGQGTGVVSGFDSTLHFEEELRYFGGPTLPQYDGGDVPTLHNPERVTNERFYWEHVTVESSKTILFNCAPVLAPGANVTLKLRIAGNAVAVDIDPNLGIPPPVNRPVDIYLNTHIQLGRIVVRDTVDTVFEFVVPANYLVNGPNSLTFRPQVMTGTLTKNEILVDYLELVGKWLPTTWGSSASVVIPSGTTGPQRLRVDGLTAPANYVISGKSRREVDSLERGHTFRLSSRQFPPNMRINPGFIASLPGEITGSGFYESGVVLLEVDGGGVLKKRTYFNTFSDDESVRIGEYRAAVQWLRNVPAGNYVLAGFGVGFGKPGSETVTVAADELRTELVTMGSRELSTRTPAQMYVGSWAFAVRKGENATAQERYAVYPANDRGVAFNAFFPNPAGNSYRAVVTVDGVPGEEFQISQALPLSSHLHERDILSDAANQADLIVITHPLFRAEVERLAAHRRSVNKLNTYVADVTTIYDEYNNGIKSPWAIRKFLQHADQSWKRPAPAYVLLFGDATSDPARHNPTTVLEDFVPTPYVPVADYIYTVQEGDTTLAPRQFIGRMPAASTSDARAIVDKLIEYDLSPPAAWNRRIVFAAGGLDSTEVRVFHQNDLFWAENYFLSPLFKGDTGLVYRTSTNLHFPDKRDGEWFRNEVNKGAFWVNFTGHGSVGTVDLDYGLPEEYDNGNKYFVFGTYSCQTGAFADPIAQSRNEAFVRIPGKGAIATFGNTAWSYTDIDDALKRVIFPSLTSPPWYRTNLGEIFTLAKYDMYFNDYRTRGHSGNVDSIRGKNALLTYLLLGDPSMTLAVRSTVELALPPEDALVTNNEGKEAGVGDSTITVNAQLWSYGTAINSDSVSVVAVIVESGVAREYRDTLVVHNPARSNQISFVLPVSGKPGQFLVRLEVDPDRRFSETYLPDNVLSLDVRIRGNQPLPIEPLPFGRVDGYDNVVIRLLNPPSGPGATIEVDTIASFDSPARFSNNGTGSMSMNELTTNWTFSIPLNLRTVKKFWWRAIATSGDTAVARLFPLIETFTVENGKTAEFMIGGVGQMKEAEISQLASTEDGVGPGTRQVTASIEAIGQTFNYDPVTGASTGPLLTVDYWCAIFIDGKGYGKKTGINIAILPPGETVPRLDTALVFYEGVDRVETFLALLDSVKPGETVLLASGGVTFNYMDDSTWGPKLRAALKSVGSTVADSIEREDSYALIGGRDAQNNPVTYGEAWKSRNQLVAQRLPMPYRAFANGTLTAVPRAGSVTLPAIGPASVWKSLTLDRTGVVPVTLKAYGIRRDGTQDSLVEVAGATTVDLSTVDATKYPRLQLTISFPNDTRERLRATHVEFDPSPELAIVPSTFGPVQDSVLQGDEANLKATIVNLSRQYPADSVAVRMKSVDEASPILSDSVLLTSIAPMDSTVVNFAITTDRLRSTRILEVIANDADTPAEPYRHNNRRTTGLRVGVDSLPPGITIYADGARLMDGDFVAPRPEFEVRIFDNSKLKLEGVKTVQILLDNEIIDEQTPGAQFIQTAEGERRGVFIYTPENPLDTGVHYMRLVTTDATGNADTMPSSAPGEFIQFYVERNLKLKSVANWPNPFQEQTTFTFMAAGETRPSSGEIAIFTVSGRKIKTIRLTPNELNIGFNRIDWDGRDEDGDRIANGSYMYRVTIEDGQARQQVIETLVVLR